MNSYIRIIFLFSLSLIVQLLNAQTEASTSSEPIKKTKADRLYEKEGYMAANKLYTKELKNTKRTDLYKKLADSYRLNDLNKEAEANYAQYVGPTSPAEDILHYAQVLLYNGKCKEAVEYFNYYKALVDKDRATQLITSCDELNGFAMHDNIDYVNAEGINSPYLDFSPVYYKNGLIFTSGRQSGSAAKHTDAWTQKEFPDVYYAASEGNGKFGKVESLSWDLNTKYNDGTVTFNPDGTEMYYSSNNKNGKSKSGIRDLKIYTGRLKNGNWVNSGALPFNSNDYATCHPALSPDGNVLVFSSDMPNGFGGMDLYACKRENTGVWSSPVNLGKEINSAGNEIFPFIDQKGELFFSSDGLKGMGGLDIFTANMGDNNMHWVTPTNLGYPFNSNKDDLCYISATSGHEGYFSSNREGGVGEDDIYYWKEKLRAETKKAPTGPIFFTFNEKENSKPIKDLSIKLYNDKSEPVEFVTNEKGNLNRPVSTDEFKFMVVEKKGYKTANFYVSPDMINNPDQSTLFIEKETTAPVSIEPTVVPVPIVVPEPEILKKELTKKYLGNENENFSEGKKFELKDIYYDYDEYFIRPDASVNLEDLIKLLNTFPTMAIELSSHTDSRGKSTYNQQLSQKRAEAARAYLIQKGIDSSRIDAKGYGESKLKNKCKDGVNCTEEEHQENRRTEVKILKM